MFSCGDDVSQGSEGSSGSTGSDPTGSTSTMTMPGSTTTDPSSTTDSMTTGVDSSSSGTPVECGNGVVEGDEQCDDRNDVDGDGCYSNCTLPYEVLWTETHDESGDADFASRAVFDAEGNLYVLGHVEVAGQGFDLWLRQYLPDGSAGWTYTYNGMANEDEFGRHLVWHNSGDLLLVGSTETDTEDDILVMRLDISNQTPVWIDIYNGPGTGPEPIDVSDFGDGIFGASNGDVLVGGTQRVDGQEFDVWLRRYDADGNELWTQTYNNDAFNGSDSSDSVLEDSNGDIYLVGATEVAQSVFEAWIRKYDSTGTEIWTQQLPTRSIREAQLDSMDNLVLAGFDSAAGLDIWVGKYDPDFNELGTTAHDGPSGLADIARGVAIDATGDVYIGGYVTVVGEIENVWVGRYQSDLQMRWWSDSYGNEESTLADEAASVAVSDDGTRVAVAGFESVIGQDANVWVRMYQNNPVPQ